MMIDHLTLSTLAIAVPGVDWVYQFTNNLTALTTANGGALTALGLAELSFIALLTLVGMVVNWSTSTMSFSWNAAPVQAGDLVLFLTRLAVCSLLITYWVNPLPGVGFGLNHLFSYIAQRIVQVLDQNSLSNFQQLIATANQQTGTPSLVAPIEILCYYLVKILLGLASAVLFVINVSSFVMYGVSALFGPLFIPLYMTKLFRGKFLHFVDVLLSFAMIRAVAAAFIFVWGGFMNTFLSLTFAGNYSIEMWLTNLVPVLMVFLAFCINMLAIPSITQAIFGGSAGVSGSVEAAAIRLAVLAGK
jgi:hypothetical protein